MTALAVGQFSLVAATGIPEFMCSAEQNEMLGKAAVNVARHFPSVLTQKQQDIIVFVSALGTVAFAQFTAYNKRVFNEKAEAAKPVNDFPNAMRGAARHG